MTSTTRTGALLALLLACSGGGQGGSPVDPAPHGFFAHAAIGPDGALPAEGLALEPRGAVLRLLDDGVAVTVRDAAELGAHLRPGMVVTLRGEVRAGAVQLAEIVHRALARGPLAGEGESSLAIAGTEALLGPGTQVLDAAGAPVAPGDLAAGAFLEVSGWPEGGARVQASAVRVLPGAPSLRLRGYGLSAPVAGVFALALVPGGEAVLTVDASGVVPAPDVPAAALVRVDGAGIAAGLLAATGVGVEAEPHPLPGDVAVVEGVVTQAGGDELVLGSHRVRLLEGTGYAGVPAGGTIEAALAPGVRVLARGVAAPDGLVVADALRLVDVRRHAGRISHFNVGLPSTFGSFQVNGAVVSLGPYTSITDAAGVKRTISELADLHGAEPQGLPVTVHGHAELDGTVRAYRVQVTAG